MEQGKHKGAAALALSERQTWDGSTVGASMTCPFQGSPDLARGKTYSNAQAGPSLPSKPAESDRPSAVAILSTFVGRQRSLETPTFTRSK